MGLGLLLCACPSVQAPQLEPVVERDTGDPSSSASEVPDAECEGLPSGIGEARRRFPRLELPGQARALVSHQRRAWACGRTDSGAGFLVSMGIRSSGSPRQIEARSLASPCQGLVLAASGLALLLDAGQVLWLPNGQAELRGEGSLIQTSAQTLPPARPWRGAWSGEDASIYLAAGPQGVLRFQVVEDALIQDPDFAIPELQDARDVALRGTELIVADAAQGVFVWNLEQSKLQASWRDLDYLDGPGTQRVVAISQERLAVAAGHAGSYLLELSSTQNPSGFEVIRHAKDAAPAFDVGVREDRLFTLTASRLYEEQTLLGQSFPELEGEGGFEALALGPEQSLWLAREGFVELWNQPSALRGARVQPLLGFGTVLQGVTGNATSELSFEVQGTQPLWVQRPEAERGSGVSVEALDWPSQAPSCFAHARFEPGERFSLRVRASNPEKLPKTVRLHLRSNDAVHADLAIPIDVDPPRPRERVGGRLPDTALMSFEGPRRRVQRPDVWNWLEFLPSQRLSSPDTLAGLSALADLVQQERRNGRRTLVVSVVVGGPYPVLAPLRWAELERLRGRGLEFYFDERFAMHRSVAHLPNGRLYPLRVLVDPTTKIRYLDQHLGSATATARYRELR